MTFAILYCAVAYVGTFLYLRYYPRLGIFRYSNPTDRGFYLLMSPAIFVMVVIWLLLDLLGLAFRPVCRWLGTTFLARQGD